MAADPNDKTKVLQPSELDGEHLRKGHAALVVLKGAEIGRDFRLRRGTTVIGRGVDADVRLPDDLASREHARLEYTWDPATGTSSFVLIDQKSTNHTFVNSRRVERAALEDGDKIRIGTTVLKFLVLDDIETKFHEEVRSRITYDQLSGLLTRESLEMALEQELKRSKAYGLTLAVLMMDLDRFKKVNDAHGHPTGSRVIAEVGRLILESIRAADVSARYGGEEFMAYLAEATPLGAMQAAERVRRSIEEYTFRVDDVAIRITISIGVALFPGHGRDIKTLVARADKALYRAKKAGRNRVCLEPSRRTTGKTRKKRTGTGG